jgi:hypothetical protein
MSTPNSSENTNGTSEIHEQKQKKDNLSSGGFAGTLDRKYRREKRKPTSKVGNSNPEPTQPLLFC